MKSKLIRSMFSVLSFALMSTGLTSCGHEHTFAAEWTFTPTEHYHAATCEHTDMKKDVGAHDFGEWTITKDPTETEKGKKEHSCKVCDYKESEVIPVIPHEHKYSTEWTYSDTQHWHAATCGHDVKGDLADHAFGEWVIDKEATVDETGLKTRTCDVCKYVQEEIIPKHVHTYDETAWASDTTGHWHPATCGHEDAKGAFADHTFGEWEILKEVNDNIDGLRKRSCDICGFEEKEVIKADTAVDDEGELTPYRFESEGAKLQNSRNTDHLCNAYGFEFSPSFSGNLCVCNYGNSPYTFTFTSDKNVRSDLIIRMSNQNSAEYECLLQNYVDITINGKHFIDLNVTYDNSTAEPAENSNATYFSMVTVNTKISIAKGENTLVITPRDNSYFNMDYLEINTSATIVDTTEKSITDTEDIWKITAPTESATGKIAPLCKIEGCKNSPRERILPVIGHNVYKRTDTENKAAYSISLLGKDVEIVSTEHKLTVEGATFHNGKTSDFVIPGSVVDLNVDIAENQTLSYWQEVGGAERKFDKDFTMPAESLTIKPVLINLNPSTITIEGGTLNDSSTINTYSGKEIALSEINLTATAPEGHSFKGWYIADDAHRMKLYNDTLIVPEIPSFTLAPIFDTDNYYNTSTFTGKIKPTGDVYLSKEKNCKTLIDDLTSGAVRTSTEGALELGSIYRFGAADNQTEIPVGGYFITQEMNRLQKCTDKKLVTATVENFSDEDVTLKFTMTTSSGSPLASSSICGQKEVTIKAGEVLTFTYELTKVHDSIMNCISVQGHAVKEIHIGLIQYISDIAA